jgi:hypothetical protein
MSSEMCWGGITVDVANNKPSFFVVGSVFCAPPALLPLEAIDFVVNIFVVLVCEPLAPTIGSFFVVVCRLI